jgi:hypothetical protein
VNGVKGYQFKPRRLAPAVHGAQQDAKLITHRRVWLKRDGAEMANHLFDRAVNSQSTEVALETPEAFPLDPN